MQRRCIALLLALCALSLSSAVRGQVNQESVRVIAGERESGTLSPLLPTIHKVALAFKPGASAAAWGQRVALEGTVQDIATSKVHGIKIVSSSLDSKTHSGTVTFQNDSKKEIQAVQGEVTVTHVNGRVAMARALWASWDDVYRAARMKVRPNDPASKMWVNRVARGPLKPGESFTQDFSYGFTYGEGEEIAGVTVLYEFVVYSDNTAESVDDKMLHGYIDNCLNCSRRTDALVQAATDILNAEVKHPFTSFLKLADERNYGFARLAYEMPQAGDSDAVEAAKLKGFIAVQKEISKDCIESSRVKVVGQ